MSFACLSVANVYYGLFDKLQVGPPPALQIMTGSVIATHYDKNGELFGGPEDQLMLVNDEIVGDVGDAGKAENAGDVEKVEDEGDGGDTRNTRKAGNAEDLRDPGDTRDKEAGRGNDGAVDGGDQEDGDNKVGYGDN